jgi:pimeloyl-ACP methyl ester carboxylesterase
VFLGSVAAIAVVGLFPIRCSKQTNPVASAPPAAIQSATQIISAANGGAITLPGGSSVAIAPGTFPTDTTMTLSLFSEMGKQPPNGLIQSVGVSLRLAFGGSAKKSSGPIAAKRAVLPSSGLELVIAYDSNMTALTGSDAMADVVDLSGNDNFVCPPGTYDSASRTATYTVQLPVVSEMANITVGQANFNPAITGAVPPRYGPRIWTKTGWAAFPQGFDKTKKTLVVVHGILSNVEAAFGPCLNDIMTAGGYDQVIGFDYDWTKSADQEGTLLADFLDSLNRAGLSQVDVEAHSYGGLVSLDALSKSLIKVNNLITEGTPLAGTPLASMALSAEAAKNTLVPLLTDLYNREGLPDLSNYAHLTLDQRSAIDNELGQVGFPTNLTTLQDLVKAGLTNGFINDLSKGSAVINQVVSGPNPPNFIRVAGTKNTMNPNLDNWLFNGQANDTYTPSTSAAGNGLGLPGPAAFYFNEEHEKLECNQDVIKDVGIAVKNGTGVTCTDSIFPTGRSFDSAGGSGSVTVTAGSGCAWTAEVDNVDWITVTSSGSNTGSGTVDFSVQPNASTDPRTGSLFVAGKEFAIVQTGRNGGGTTSPDSFPTGIPTGMYTADVVLTSVDGTTYNLPSFADTNTGGPSFSQSLLSNINSFLSQVDGVDANGCSTTSAISFTPWNGTSFKMIGTLVIVCPPCGTTGFCYVGGTAYITYTVTRDAGQ